MRSSAQRIDDKPRGIAPPDYAEPEEVVARLYRVLFSQLSRDGLHRLVRQMFELAGCGIHLHVGLQFENQIVFYLLRNKVNIFDF
jgi:hypothetical protein